MESLSRPVRSVKIPLTVAIPDYLWDHHYDGRIVLPAAEALQILARSLPGDLPPCDPHRQEGGAFAHLLPLDTNADVFSAFHEIAFFPDGRRQSRLTTLRTGRQTQWTRSIEHVSVPSSLSAVKRMDLRKDRREVPGVRSRPESSGRRMMIRVITRLRLVPKRRGRKGRLARFPADVSTPISSPSDLPTITW
jgi:hypothetical protein